MFFSKKKSNNSQNPTKYIVIWDAHRNKGEFSPYQWMGISNVYDTLEEAKETQSQIKRACFSGFFGSNGKLLISHSNELEWCMADSKTCYAYIKILPINPPNTNNHPYILYEESHIHYPDNPIIDQSLFWGLYHGFSEKEWESLPEK